VLATFGKLASSTDTAGAPSPLQTSGLGSTPIATDALPERAKLRTQAAWARADRRAMPWSTAMAAWLSRWECGKAHACVVGWRTRRRG
jgi:hypothetical protein